MTDSSRKAWISFGAVVLYVGAITLLGLSNFGIWDPWELDPADHARLFFDSGVSPQSPPLAPWLTGAAFHVFGVREWAGRIPIAGFGIAFVGIVFVAGKRFADHRTGLYGAWIASTTPLFILNSRQMNGDAIAFAASTLILLCGLSALIHPSSKQARLRPASGLWLLGMAFSIAMAVLARGILLGVLPPMLALTGLTLLNGDLQRPFRNPRRSVVGGIITVTTGILTAITIQAVYRDADEYSHILGGHPVSGHPATFEQVIESVFYGFAPWSAVILVAVGWIIWSAQNDLRFSEAEAPAPDAAITPGRSDETHAAEASTPAANRNDLRRELGLVMLLWTALAYAALTLFTSRYGSAPYPALAGLAVMVGLFLAGIERTHRSHWPASLVTVLLTGLVLRDFALYPESPLAATGILDFHLPEGTIVFGGLWAGLLSLFALALIATLGASPATAPTSAPETETETETQDTVDRNPRSEWFFASFRPVQTAWNRGRGFRTWLSLLGAILTAGLAFGLLAAFGPKGGSLMSSQASRIGRGLLVVILLVPVAVVTRHLFFAGIRRFERLRVVPVVLVGALIGVFVAHDFLPTLSEQLSPREIYDTLNALRKPGEPVAEYRIGSRAGAYYAEGGEPTQIQNQNDILTFLSGDGQRWAMIPADQLAPLDREFRTLHHQHLFVPASRSTRIRLVSNQGVDGQINENPLAEHVLSSIPETIEHRLEPIRFGDKIELLGYKLDLPEEGYVGAGQSFDVTWYWRCLRPLPGGWKVFVHIDGFGLRMNGDHEPVDGAYPVRLWDQGDVIVDRQTIEVPRHFRTGSYTMFIGFYAGNNRLEIVTGPKDDDKRARTGMIHVR